MANCGKIPLLRSVLRCHGWLRDSRFWTCLIALFLLPLVLLLQGYFPNDDALRHVAKVVSGRDWSDIIVFRPEVYSGFDSHPGWHVLLGAFHRIGFGSTALVWISTLLGWWLIFVPIAVLTRRADLLLVITLVVALLQPAFIARFLLGRPFLFSAGALCVYFWSWPRLASERTPWRLCGVLSIVAALQVWIHPSWYLMAIPIFVFGVSGILRGSWREPVRFGLCMALGILAGAVLTGYPLEILVYYFRHMVWAVVEAPAAAERVPELAPLPVIGLLPLLLFWPLAVRWLKPGWKGLSLAHPAYLLAVGGWIMGFWVARFFSDWGIPALLFYLVADHAEASSNRDASKPPWMGVPALITASFWLIAMSLVLMATWSSSSQSIPAWHQLAADEPDWLPGDEGVVFTVDMAAFFNLFYVFPSGHWMYMLGFEPGMMPPEHLQVYQQIKRTKDLRIFNAWALSMHPQDRLIIRTPQTAPVSTRINTLDWKFLPPSTWVGRPQQTTAP